MAHILNPNSPSKSMAFLQFPPTSSLHLPPLFPHNLPRHQTLFISSKPPFKSHSKPISTVHRASPNALPMTEQQIIDAIAESDGEKENSLPAVRSYENDLARLTFIGAVSFEQALIAAAADGGNVADEHIAEGVPTMVIETVFPGSSDEHSTVSTRLFIPAKKVKEKARKLRNSLTTDILSSTSTKNILAMTFRQVILQRVWSFELVLFSPGTERNMQDLANPGEVPTYFTLSSSDDRVLSVLAEAVCSCVLESTKRDFRETMQAMSSNSVFGWLQKPKRTASKDNSVFICTFSQPEIVANAKNRVSEFNSIKGKYRIGGLRSKCQWWASPTYSKLNKVGGPEFSIWTSEYIPAYRLQIDGGKYKNLKFEGWQKSSDNRWEVLLTHFQMVGLANILDMYYEDPYTLPDKQLSCGLVAEFSGFSNTKKGSLWKVLSIAFATGCTLVFISILAQLYKPQFFKARKSPAELSSASLSETDSFQLQSLDGIEVDALCISVVEKIKDALGWPGDIVTEADVGAWAGALPSYLRTVSDKDLVRDADSSNGEGTATQSSGDLPTHANLYNSITSPSDKSDRDMEATSAQDIASYQVVVSRDGKIIGFQPTSRLAVNHWAGNPLAKALYGGKKLSPGFLEPSLKICRHDKIAQIELLMSINSESWFVLARPAQLS